MKGKTTDRKYKTTGGKWKITDEKWRLIDKFFDRVFADPESAPDKALLLPLAEKEITQIFTKKRIELIKVIKARRPRTVSVLSQMVKRDLTAVQRDLKFLEKFGIVKLEKKGREVKPSVDMEVLILPVVPIKPMTVEEIKVKK